MRLASVREQIEVARQNTLALTREQIVSTAKAAHAEVMASDPRPTSFTRYVDGAAGAEEEAVKPNGVILYDYPRLPVVVEFALEQLRQFSPILTGRYRDSHTIYLNGSPVTSMAGWTATDEVVITNTLPYARVIEMGKMKMRVDGTSQVYEQAVSATNRRYGNLAKALFTYRGVVAGAAINPAGIPLRTKRGPGGRYAANGGASPHNVSENRFPAIVFTER